MQFKKILSRMDPRTIEDWTIKWGAYAGYAILTLVPLAIVLEYTDSKPEMPNEWSLTGYGIATLAGSGRVLMAYMINHKKE